MDLYGFASRADVTRLVDGGDGKTLPAYLAAYPATMAKLLDSVSDTVGVDVTGILKGTASDHTGPNGAGGRKRTTLRDTPAVATETERRTV